MTNFVYYIWLIILILYILSPLDAHPLFVDDLIAVAVLFYIWYKHSLTSKRAGRTETGAGRKRERPEDAAASLSLKDAYSMLGVGPDASLEDIKKAYRKKIAGAHPDKVEHLGEELKQKAREITLGLNKAYDIISRNRTR